ncbi:MAG: ATP-dependent zinc metalloprotease FtsH [Candidatus Aminicenantes bacterium]|nr:ATP-dependent zinc metalloprotease FtsH [Candidatus Aminicenantes bacterium]
MENGEKDDRIIKAKEKKDKEKPGVNKNGPIIGLLDPKKFYFFIWYFLAMLVILLVFHSLFFKTPGVVTIDFSEFKRKIETKEIRRVELGEKFYIGLPLTKEEADNASAQEYTEQQPGGASQTYKTARVSDPDFIKFLDSKQIQYYAKPPESKTWQNLVFSWVIPIIFFIVVWRFISKRLGMAGQRVMSFGENRAKLVAEGDTGVNFKDVAGVDEAKAELVEVVDFLTSPGKYHAIGGKIPKGVLLVGPPGTGKTLLAKAVAGEAKVPFFRISGADFVEMFVGVGAARVRDLFKQARDKAPCIVFVDELDAIGKGRGISLSSNDEREQTLNQLLVEMDGFDSRTGVIILAATNRPEILDPALMRPGRFDRQVLVDRPDINGREAILKIHARDVKLDESTDLKKVAQGTPGFSGADLANIVNEAALLAVRSGRNLVMQGDFDNAIERVIAGLEKKNRLINPKERKIVAYHETGHAMVAAHTEGADPVHKISIVPRGIGALGYTIQLPTEERFLMTQDELMGRIDVLLGGRGCEQLFFGKVSTGAANDISQATEIARKMITDYGMSAKFGNIVLNLQRSPLFLPPQVNPAQREYSEATQQYIDEEITRIVNMRYEKVLKFLESKKPLIEKIAEKLLIVEVIEGADFKAML